MKWLSNVLNFLSPSGKILRSASYFAADIEALKEKFALLTDEELRAKTDEFKEKIKNGIALDLIMAEAFATVRETAKRSVNMWAYRVQMLGGIVVQWGDFAEMGTGEGKTLTLIFPIYLNALTGKGVHVISVNEYLVQRDAEFCESILSKLGITVGYVIANQSPNIKRENYARDVTYITNSEVGFDYLRDNMCTRIEDKVQRGLNFAIVDEGDSVLIDEARTPLIISGGDQQDPTMFVQVDACVKAFAPHHYNIDRESRAVSLTPEGAKFAEQFLKVDDLFNIKNSEIILRINNALMANKVFINGVEYMVKDGKIFLIDQSTGRVMDGRSYSNGLQQAIQAKEHVEIEPENTTIATVTYQSLFRLYGKLAAVSGTAMTESEEFAKIYNLTVVKIPPNRPLNRVDLPDKLYGTKKGKWDGVATEIIERHKTGQPILVGTSSVEESEYLAEKLQHFGIVHEILNAKNNAREAEIVAKAGQKGAVTISTNMAGRGTDIKLGEGVVELGGLFVIGTNKHESRRIDNQLRGRSGRQGDPGASQFYISTQDELFKRFGRENLQDSEKVSASGDKALESKMWTRALASAQKRIEHLNFDTRKNLMDYDQILADHRELIYKQRDALLGLNDNKAIFKKILKSVITDLSSMFIRKENPNQIDEVRFSDAVNTQLFGRQVINPEQLKYKTPREVSKLAYDIVTEAFFAKNKDVPEMIINQVIRDVIIKNLDSYWQVHIDRMMKLRDGVQLRSMEQVNPLDIYIADGNKMFKQLAQNVAHQVAVNLLNASIERNIANESGPQTVNIQVENQEEFEKIIKQMQAIATERGMELKVQENSPKPDEMPQDTAQKPNETPHVTQVVTEKSSTEATPKKTQKVDGGQNLKNDKNSKTKKILQAEEAEKTK